MDKVIAYYSRRKIDLTLPVLGILHWNLPMDSSNFRIYKGSKNSIEVVVRNNDRKAINLGSALLIMTIVDPESNQIVVQKQLVVRDPLQGSAILILDRFDTVNWMLGFYRWSIVLQDPETSQSVLYIDQNENGYGYFELIEGPVIGPADSLVCTDFLAGEFSLNQVQQFFVSSAFPGNAQVDNHDYGFLTFAAYMTTWTGQIFIDGCIEDSMPVTEDGWFPVSINNAGSTWLDRFSGVYPISVEASLQWVRLRYLSDVLNQGTFDKVLFRT